MRNVIITLPDQQQISLALDADDVVTVTVDGQELIGVFGDSGAGWWPTGDGGETNGDWTPLDPDGYGLMLNREQLEAWTGRELTRGDIAILARCIPNSSIPESIRRIADFAL